MNILRVLSVEDSETDALLLREMLRDEPVKLLEITQVKEAKAYLAKRIDVILSDLCLPDARGIEVIEALRRMFPSVPIVALSGMSTEEIEEQLMRAGVDFFLDKNDLSTRLVMRSLNYAVERKKIESDASRNAITRLNEIVRKVRDLDSRRGQTGAGDDAHEGQKGKNP